MNLINGLRKKKGQSTVEYFVLFAIIAGLTFLSISTAFPQMRNAGDHFFNRAVKALE